MPAASRYAQKIDPLQDDCPVRAALDVIRGRWKPSLLLELKSGPKRFTELRASMRGVTAQALTVQLRQLEADGVIVRTVFAEVPARVEYRLGEFGESLSALMDQLETWGAAYLRRRRARSTRR